MQPNQMYVAQLGQASRTNAATQGTNPAGPLGVTQFADANSEQAASQQLAAASQTVKNPAKAGATGPTAAVQQAQNTPPASRTGIEQGQTTASGLISSNMAARRI